MSKKNRKKPKRRSSSISNRHRHQPKSKKEAKQTSSRTWKWLARAGVIIAIIGVLIYLYPEVELYPETSINPYDPFETPFVVQNSGNISVLELNIVEKHTIKGERGLNVDGATFTPTAIQTQKLSPDERTTFMPGHTVRLDLFLITSMEIEFNVSYSVFLIPYSFEKQFRYVAARNTKGEFQWYAKSMAE